MYKLEFTRGYFLLLHAALQEQYAPCHCAGCESERLHLAKNDDFQTAFKSGLNALKKLFQRGAYRPEDLRRVPEYRALTGATHRVFSSAITPQVPQALRDYLERDAFVFSGLKTHAQLTEARQYLKDENGPVPYHKFEQQVLKLNAAYNKNYLEAEYLFARQSAQSAANWGTYGQGAILQYRTAADDRVRVSHQGLNRITLPKTDPFWERYYPPNGWRCRCRALEVPEDDHPPGDSQKAQAEGQRATSQIGKTGVNKLQMFRFNPGLEQKIFPPANSYTKTPGASQVAKTMQKEAEKASIYHKPFQEQFDTYKRYENGGRVELHKLLDTTEEDHRDKLIVAVAHAKAGGHVKLLPIVPEKEKGIRSVVFKGLASETANPDFLFDDTEYADLKRPKSIRNIESNANRASKQGAVAVISDVDMDKPLTEEVITDRIRAIMKGKHYQFDKIYFFVNGKLRVVNRTSPELSD